jgi:hypothetical protein
MGGSEKNRFRFRSRLSPRMFARIPQESFEKRKQEDRCDRANAHECNLNHMEHLARSGPNWNSLLCVVLKRLARPGKEVLRPSADNMASKHRQLSSIMTLFVDQSPASSYEK